MTKVSYVRKVCDSYLYESFLQWNRQVVCRDFEVINKIFEIFPWQKPSILVSKIQNWKIVIINEKERESKNMFEKELDSALYVSRVWKILW